MFEHSMVAEDSSVLMSKMMQMSIEKQRVIANNISNANTPGYIRKVFSFEKQLANLVKNNDLDGIRKLEGDVVQDFTDTPRIDGNNVKVPKEINQMIQNSVFYSLMTKSFATKMNMIKSAIAG